ncbi:hypothetical protein TARUN_5955 [Trichoderma arundinaceum]|uniref:Uncharacterized protein n=1 Tax=Trichoderma arundinaceum TaxID=490622 RepID=A0A395NK80_TRIAR|nr:hypothetical protein TARUN_5955 [Trichoderma arundinaceum]
MGSDVPVNGKAGSSAIASGDDMGATKKDAGYEETQSDFRKSPNAFPNLSDGISILLHVNETLLPGFDRKHIRCVAQSNSPGLRVEAQAAGAALLMMKLSVQIGHLWYPFAIVAVPMERIKVPPTANVLNTSDTVTMQTMFTIPNTLSTPSPFLDPTFDSGVVVLSPNGSRYLKSEPDMERTAPKSVVRPMALQVVRITIAAKVSDLLIGYPPPFWRQILRQQPSVQTIATDIRTLFTSMNKDDQVSFWLSFPIHPGWESDWRVFLGDKKDEVSPEQPLTDKGVFQSHLLPFPGSEWAPAASDLQEYGMAATGSPTAYLMFVNLNGIGEILPGIGARVKVHLNVGQGYHLLPRQSLTTLQIRKLAGELQLAIKKAESEAQNAIADAQARLDKTRKKKANGKEITDQEAIVEQMRVELRIKSTAKILSPFIHKISDETKGKHPNEAKCAQRWADALRAAVQFGTRNDEDEEIHIKRLANWIQCQGVALRRPKPADDGEPYMGHRLNLPYSVRADAALFYIEVPKQPNWPHGFKRPPMEIDIPKRPLPTDLQLFLANAFKKRDDVKLARIEDSSDAQSIEEACFGIYAMNLGDPNSVAGAWWNSVLETK